MEDHIRRVKMNGMLDLQACEQRKEVTFFTSMNPTRKIFQIFAISLLTYN
jgi:hypothetical protein